jgi:hypothetical protein
MALIRPVILVFQENATPTVTPTTPDLNCLVVGPAFLLRDYFKPGTTDYADKADIGLTASYGTLEAAPDSATPTGPAVLAVADAPGNLLGALVDASSVVVYFDEVRVAITSGVAGTTAAATPNQFEVGDAVDFTSGATRVLPGDRVLVKDPAGNTIARTVYAVDSTTRLRFTADIPFSGFTPGGGQVWRIERQLKDRVIDPSFFEVNGNTITIAGSVTLTVPTQGAKTVTFAKVYIAYRALRQDLVELDTLSTKNEILAKIGRLDARNPLAVGVFVALQNTTSHVQFVGVTSNDLPGHTAVRDQLASRADVYAIVPLTADVSVLAMWNTDCLGLAVPDETHGRPQRFRVVIGSGELPVHKRLIEPQTSGQAMPLAGTAPASTTRLTAPGLDFVAGGVVPGDVVRVTLDTNGVSRNGVYRVAAVVGASELAVDVSTPFPAAAVANATLEVRRSNDTTSRIALTAVTGLQSAAAADLFLTLRDPNGTFVSSGVAAGDILEMPSDPTASAFDAPLARFVVAQVLSENRLQIVNGGPDSSSVQNELPHGARRSGGAPVPSTASLSYQIVRKLSKAGQVTELVTLAQSFRSRRAILVWPDKVQVAGAVGGAAQPGYYLSCAVGGMTAGLPPHQGFTFLGLAGISQIFHSNTYFKDEQLTDLSNGGWYVFAQQTPTSLPFTIHQLTTDVSTLESGEFSVVKNFDFASLFFVDILDDFLGVYNVTPDALVLLRAALDIGGETLRMRTLAKIGAPLKSFAILDLDVSPVAGDRVVTHLALGLPKPLNAIELHLVA